MTDDWDPASEAVQHNQIAAYDAVRNRCPVPHSEAWGWSLLRHQDVVAALTDHATFSNRVSQHVAIPNGMDPPGHAAYREVVNRCFSDQRVAAFEPDLRRLTAELIDEATTGRDHIEVMIDLALPFAAKAQCAYLGWPESVSVPLLEWSNRSAKATALRDRAELDRAAAEFDVIIRDVLTQTRSTGGTGGRSVTVDLLREQVHGRPLTDDELVSMLRNWTVGELGTIAAAVGIICEFLARRDDVRARLRSGMDQRALDEMLRLEAPLISNRRRTAQSVTVSGVEMPAGAPVTIVWPAAQRDPDVFVDPEQYREDRPAEANLLYGRGIHYCPGEGLSRLELGVFTEEFLARVPEFEMMSPARRAAPPSGGFHWIELALATRDRSQST